MIKGFNIKWVNIYLYIVMFIVLCFLFNDVSFFKNFIENILLVECYE